MKIRIRIKTGTGTEAQRLDSHLEAELESKFIIVFMAKIGRNCCKLANYLKTRFYLFYRPVSGFWHSS